MVTNAGDVGYEPIASLVPLHQLLASIEHLQIASCAKLGTLELPRLEKLELTADVTVKNLRELARANLPALTERIRETKRETERQTPHQALSSATYRITRHRDSLQPHGTLAASVNGEMG